MGAQSSASSSTSGVQQTNGDINVGASSSTNYVPWIVGGLLALVGLVVMFKLFKRDK
jgi:hypothetical protein